MNKTEIILAGILIFLVVVLLNPFDVFMNYMFVMTLAGFLIAVTAFFTGVIWRESEGDEREVLHQMLAGRIAFIVGTVVLVVGIVVQSITQSVDIWLVIALVSMVLIKIIGRVYARNSK
ncbi:MAG: hypothetical protein WD509_01750 [Candidatus Paceibacterota bacterium]